MNSILWMVSIQKTVVQFGTILEPVCPVSGLGMIAAFG
jgi:hypothetical protein